MKQIRKTMNMWFFSALLGITGTITASEQSEYKRYLTLLTNESLKNKEIREINHIFYDTVGRLLWRNQSKYCFCNSCNNTEKLLNYFKNSEKRDITFTLMSHYFKASPSDKEMKILDDIRLLYSTINVLPFEKKRKIYNFNQTCVRSHEDVNLKEGFSVLLQCMKLSYEEGKIDEKSKINDNQVHNITNNDNHKVRCTMPKPSCQK